METIEKLSEYDEYDVIYTKGFVVMANPTLHCFPVAPCIPKPIHP